MHAPEKQWVKTEAEVFQRRRCQSGREAPGQSRWLLLLQLLRHQHEQ